MYIDYIFPTGSQVTRCSFSKRVQICPNRVADSADPALEQTKLSSIAPNGGQIYQFSFNAGGSFSQ